MFLLDTVVVTALRQARTDGADVGVAAWAAGLSHHDLFVSALSLLELHGAAQDASRLDNASGAAFWTWIANRVMPAFDGRILPVDTSIVQRSAALDYADTRDALLVATALQHGLTLVTRHVSAYKTGKPKLFSPWGYVPREEAEDWREAARGGSQWFKNLFVRV